MIICWVFFESALHNMPTGLPVVVKKKMPFSCQEGIRRYVFLGNHCGSHKKTLYIEVKQFLLATIFEENARTISLFIWSVTKELV